MRTTVLQLRSSGTFAGSTWMQKRGLWLIGIVLVLGGCGAPTAPVAQPGGYELVVANADEGGSASALDGATLHGSVTVRLAAEAGVARVEYALADIARSTASPVVTASRAPFVATIDTNRLGDGEHELAATIHRGDGAIREVKARFSVDNRSCRPLTSSSGWTAADVGVVDIEGNTVVCAGATQFTMSASGSDVWNGSDGFRFTYQPLRGDGSLTVRVDSLDAVHEWTKVGLMVREDLSAEARNAFVLLTNDNGAVFQRRETVGGTTADVLPDGTYMRAYEPTAPWWLRIERQGSVLIGSHSSDGSAWTELGRLTLALPEDVLIGMAVTSNSDDALATGVFSNVSLEHDGGGGFIDDGVLPPVPLTGPTVSSGYARSTEVFPNPERGWHGSTDSGGYAGVAAQGFTLVRQYVRLDDYRNQPLPQSLLDDLRGELSALRTHGLKIVLRFSYNHGEQPDASREMVLQHIAQVTPVVEEYADVIAVLQAGFIGYWGEWHSSTNDLLTFDNRRAITDALLGMLPDSRMIQIRYPYRARDLFAVPTAATAFQGSDSARVGQVNDCFLTNSHDGGTFASDADYVYMESVTPFTVMGGETCALGGLNDRNDGANAVAEMERFHFDYLQHEFWVPIIDKWRSQGYYDEISRRLGYRYVLQETVSQAAASAGQTFSLSVRVENEGFGKLYNPRPIELVLRPRSGGAPVTLRAANDARTVMPLAGETRTVPLTVRIPNNLASGTYDVHLRLPDAASTLAGDARYAIRFANDGVWSGSTGENALNVALQID